MPHLQQLRPFSPQPWLEGIRLEAGASWAKESLVLTYRLEDAGSSLRMATSIDRPERRDGLWQSTCFEAFIGVVGDPAYWEVNLAANGDWNVYRLDAYRHGLRAEPAINALAHTLEQGDGSSLELQIPLHLNGWIDPTAPLELSLTAVLDQAEHGCSYWAWDHDGPEPDFHQRSSFRPIPKRK